MPYDPIILLDTYPEKSIIHKDTYTERLYFWGSKITADGDYSHGIKKRLFLERKAMAHLDMILKSRDITLPTKLHVVNGMVFPIVTGGCESWDIKKAEH